MKHHMIAKGLAACALILIGGTVSRGSGPAYADQGQTPWPAFTKVYHDALTQHAIVGSSVALVKDGRIIARDHAGLRDRTGNLPVDNNTIFHWASITKTFTAIGIMQLRDRGLITLDDPIVKYVPELRKVSNPFGPMETITIRQLLSHSAGFRGGTWPFTDDQDWMPFEPPGWEQLAAMMPYTRIEFAPGSKYSYSNPGYVFLGRVIEDVMQEPYETYIDKEIFKPLGMTRAFFDRAPSFLRADKSHSYFVTDAGLTEARFDFDTGVTVYNGGLNAPIDDMAKYLGYLMGDAQQQGRFDAILKRSSLEELWKPVVTIDASSSMGLGFFLEQHAGLNVIAHSGGQNGFISHFYLLPSSHLAYIVAFNTQTTSDKEGDKRNTRALDAMLRDYIIEHLFR